MNIVTFPGLNLKFNINRIAISIGNISIYWYGILIASALVIGLIILKIRDGKFGIKFSNILDLSIILIPISIIFARLYYVIFNANYYISNPMQIFNLRNGGLAIYGGIIGGAITCYIYCKSKKINLLNLLDYIVPSLALRTIYRKMGQLYKPGGIWI